MPTIQDLRADFPDLGDLDDEQLIGAVQQALYPDMPRERVAAHFGVKPRPVAAPAAAPAAPSGVLRRAADVGLAIGKGIIGVPEALVGMGNLVSGGRAGQMAEQVGIRFKDAKDILNQAMSPEALAAQEQFQQSEGVVDALGTAVRNPSLIVNAAAESLPMMGMGGAIARPLMAAAPRLGVIGAAATGEGITAAGSGAEQIRQQTADGLLTGTQSAIAAASGAATGLLGVLGGKVAQRLGIADVDTLIAGGAGPVVTKGFVRRVLEGAAAEGLLEELPQSVQEQVAQNFALGRPLDEGVPQAAVLGALTGGAMGGAANALAGRQPGPLERAVQTVVPQVPPVDPAVDPGAAPGSPAVPGMMDFAARRQAAAEAARRAMGDMPAPSAPTAPSATTEQPSAPGAEPDADGVVPPPAAAPVQPPLIDARVQREADRPPEPTEQPQPGDILSATNKPFTTMPGAMRALKGRADTHEIKRVVGGLVVRAKPAATKPNAAAPAESPGGALRSAAPATKQPEAAAPTPEVPDAPVTQARTDATTEGPAAPTAETPAPAGAPAAPAAGVPGAGAAPALETPGVAGPAIDAEWTAFAPETGTKAIPRAEMPQVKAEHRGALTQFLKGRGITHQQERDVEPGMLKPTQAEFSPAKVRKAREFTGGDRAILVSNDGHVVDGHHQWAAALEDGKPIRVIRLDAPIDGLLPLVKEFPSAEVAAGATTPTTPTTPTTQETRETATWWSTASTKDRTDTLIRAGWTQTNGVPSPSAVEVAGKAWDKLRPNQRARIEAARGAPAVAETAPAVTPQSPSAGAASAQVPQFAAGQRVDLLNGKGTKALRQGVVEGQDDVNVQVRVDDGSLVMANPNRVRVVPATSETAADRFKPLPEQQVRARLEAAGYTVESLGTKEYFQPGGERVRKESFRLRHPGDGKVTGEVSETTLSMAEGDVQRLEQQAADWKAGKRPGTLGDLLGGPAAPRTPAPAPAKPEAVAAPAPAPQAAPAPTAAPAPKPPKRPPAAEKAAQARTDNLRAYYAPGNVVKSFGGGFDEVLSLDIREDGGFTVKVHEVREVTAGNWVRVGKPQDARQHSTFPDARELKAGPVSRLPAKPGAEVVYTEGRADGQPFKNAPDRGVRPAEAPAAAPTSQTPEPSQPSQPSQARADKLPSTGDALNDMLLSEGMRRMTTNAWTIGVGSRGEVRVERSESRVTLLRRLDGKQVDKADQYTEAAVRTELRAMVKAGIEAEAPAASSPAPVAAAPEKPDIASPNFDPGKEGFVVRQDGEAEFNNPGRVEVVTPSTPRARPEALIAARKRLSVLESLRKCIG